jgi:hypothetical protein
MLQRALAARSVAIDRSRLAVREAPAAISRPSEEVIENSSVVSVAWPYAPDSNAEATRQEVPEVVGMPVRRAVTALHRRGFKVVLHGLGDVARLSPQPGDSVKVGGTVVLWAE